MRQKIVVIGSSNIDFTMKMERLPHRGETITDAVFLQTFGGKGANQAVGAAKAGGDVWFVNCVGDDAYAPLLLDSLRQAGVQLDYVSQESGVASGAALIMVGGAGENFIAVAPGANYRLTPAMLPRYEPLLRGAGMLVLQYEVLPETLYASIDLAHALGVPVMFNLAPARPFDPAHIQKIAYLIVNENEAESLCGFAVDTPERVAQAGETLLGLGAGAALITLGAEGVYLAAGDKRRSIAGFPVRAVDTTAAGDVFCGALAVALVEGRPLAEAARFACAAAAISVTRLGAQPSAPSRSEIDQFLQQHPAIE